MQHMHETTAEHLNEIPVLIATSDDWAPEQSEERRERFLQGQFKLRELTCLVLVSEKERSYTFVTKLTHA